LVTVRRSTPLSVWRKYITWRGRILVTMVKSLLGKGERCTRVEGPRVDLLAAHR
jgi:hypothetical protein